MSAIPSRRHDAMGPVDVPQATNLLDFTHSICRLFARRMSHQGVTLSLDIDPAAHYHISRDTVGELLIQIIEQSLRAMPEGGELDVVAVIGRQGLEIEIADSGSESDFELRIHGEADGGTNTGQRTSVAGGMFLETRRCPQGGTARTLCVPRSNARAAA